jgi:uncharacterized membrane protein
MSRRQISWCYERYARGEITHDEYRERLGNLKP